MYEQRGNLTDEEESEVEEYNDDMNPDDFSENEETEAHSNEASIQKFMEDMKNDSENFENRLADQPDLIFDNYRLDFKSEIDGRTVLHCIVDEFPKLTKKTKATVRHRRALLQAVRTITARYPFLLKMPANNGITPLYSTIQCCSNINDDRLARNMIRYCKTPKDTAAADPAATGGDDDAASNADEASHPLTEALAMKCTSVSDNRSETVLHLAMRNHAVFASNMKLLKRLARRASEAAVVSRDGGKLTPLHYAVNYEWSSQEQYEIVELLLATGESPALIKEEQAVLDLRSKKGDMSVYQYHLWTRAEYKEPPPQPPKPSASAPRPKAQPPVTGRTGADVPSSVRNPMDGNKEREREANGHPRERGQNANRERERDPRGPDGDRDRRGPSDPRKDGRGGKEGPGGKEVPGGKEGPGREGPVRPKEAPSTKEGAGRGREPLPTIRTTFPARDGSERPNGRNGDHNLNSPMGYGLQRAPTAGPRVVEKERLAATKEKEKDKIPEETPEERKKMRDEWSDKIQMLLKMQCLRTRSHDASTRFLYGDNPKDIQTWFDYQGVTAELDPDVFEDSFKDVVYDTVLKYVAFPPVKVLNWDKKGEKLLPRAGRRGRSDMLFFFDWLRNKKKVERILKVIVDDSSQEPHSDAAIEKALEGFGVESLEWSKPDLDPETLYNATLTKTSPELPPSSELSEVVLRWSGNNAVLRAWGEPEGLRRLPKLKQVYLFLDETQTLESFDRIKTNIAKFEERLKEPCPQYVQKYLESKQQSKPVVPMGPPPLPGQAVLPLEPVQLVPAVKLIWVKNAYGLRQANPSLSASAPSGEHNTTLAPHRWLESADTFADHIENIWNRIVREAKKQPRKTAGGDESGTPAANTSAPLKSQGPEDIVVALIDDGVDTMEEQLAGRVLAGRTFCFQDGRNMPWYASETGHGTVMASMIARVCPMAKIYPIRLNTGAKLTAGAGAMINPEYAAKAIRAAVDRGASIISMSWSVTRPANDLREQLDKALQYALDNDVLLFCSSRDTGHNSDINYYPAAYRRDAVIKIGAAQPTGLPYEWAGSLANLDFILPGVEVVQRVGFRSPGGVQKLAPESGSSVATALAAGLAALIMYCARINQMFGSGVRLGDEDILKLRRAETMVQTIQNFGMSTSDPTKNKFVEVWRKLDDKSQKISRASPKEKREIVAQLARDLMSPSAS